MNSETIKARITRLREIMKGKDMDAALITKRENYGYLSGFTGTSAFLIISQTEAVLITDFRYKEQAAMQAPLHRIVKHEGSHLVAIEEVLRELHVKNLGFEDLEVTYSAYTDYHDKLHTKKLIPLGSVIDEMRAVKDEEEIGIIRKAIEISDQAFQHILGIIRPGLRESEVAAELEYFMKKSGALGPSFDTIVASGSRAALPHGVASEKVIEYGDIVTLDYGCIYGGYCSDITRTVFVGKKDTELEKIYNIVLESQKRAEEGIHAGMTGMEADSLARNIIEKAGFGDKFGHSLGHGAGREIHEEPRLSPRSMTILPAGAVVSVEPGIYIEGLGGVRIEDLVIVKEKEVEIMTAAPKDIIVI